jgi:hypothetical protein
MLAATLLNFFGAWRIDVGTDTARSDVAVSGYRERERAEVISGSSPDVPCAYKDLPE